MGLPSGEVGFPPYLEKFHSELLMNADPDSVAPALSTDVQTIVNSMLAGGNPYAGAASYDPSGHLDMVQEKVDQFESLVFSMDDVTDWDRMVDAAVSRVDDMMSTVDVEADVAEFAAAAKNDLARAVNRIAAGFFDINAVISTAFPSALAIVEADHLHGIARYRTERNLQTQRDRTIAILQSVSEMAKLFTIKAQTMQNVANAQLATAQTSIMTYNDQIKMDLGLQIDEANWDMTVLGSGANMMGAISGIPTMPAKLTPLQQALTGVANAAGFAVTVGGATQSLEIGAIALVAGSALSLLGTNWGQ